MLKKILLISTFFAPGVFPTGQLLSSLAGLFDLHRIQRHGPPPFSMGHKGHRHHMGNHGNHGRGKHGPPPFAQGGHGPPPFAQGGHGPPSFDDEPPPFDYESTSFAHGPPPFAHGHGHHPPPRFDYGYPDYDYDGPIHHTPPPTRQATTAPSIITKQKTPAKTTTKPATTKSTTTPATTTTPSTTPTSTTTKSTTPNYGAGEIDVRFGKPEDRIKRSTKTVDPAATTEILTRYNSLGHYPLWNTPEPNFKPDFESQPDRNSICPQKSYECVPAYECKSVPARTSNNRRFCHWAHDQPFVCCEKQKNEKLQRPLVKCGRGRTTGLSQAIIGGTSVSGATRYPWMTAVGEVLANGDVDWYCGGALVGERTVVTAAHCISRRTADVIRIGETDLRVSKDDVNSNVQQISVSNTLTHPLYRPPALYNDVALLYLEEPVQLSPFSRPICLSQSTAASDTPVALLTGWGQLSFASERSTQLKEVTIQVVNNSYCDTQYSVTQASSRYFPRGILDTLLCAGDDEGGKDACQGDSGAPLVAEEDGDLVLIGIVSAGIGCGSKTFPGVYTRVSAFTPWIYENIP